MRDDVLLTFGGGEKLVRVPITAVSWIEKDKTWRGYSFKVHLADGTIFSNYFDNLSACNERFDDLTQRLVDYYDTRSQS